MSTANFPSDIEAEAALWRIALGALFSFVGLGPLMYSMGFLRLSARGTMDELFMRKRMLQLQLLKFYEVITESLPQVCFRARILFCFLGLFVVCKLPACRLSRVLLLNRIVQRLKCQNSYTRDAGSSAGTS